MYKIYEDISSLAFSLLHGTGVGKESYTLFLIGKPTQKYFNIPKPKESWSMT